MKQWLIIYPINIIPLATLHTINSQDGQDAVGVDAIGIQARPAAVIHWTIETGSVPLHSQPQVVT